MESLKLMEEVLDELLEEKIVITRKELIKEISKLDFEWICKTDLIRLAHIIAFSVLSNEDLGIFEDEEENDLGEVEEDLEELNEEEILKRLDSFAKELAKELINKFKKGEK